MRDLDTAESEIVRLKGEIISLQTRNNRLRLLSEKDKKAHLKAIRELLLADHALTVALDEQRTINESNSRLIDMLQYVLFRGVEKSKTTPSS